MIMNFIQYKNNDTINLDLVQNIHKDTPFKIKFYFQDCVLNWNFNTINERDYVFREISNKFHFWSPKEYNN